MPIVPATRSDGAMTTRRRGVAWKTSHLSDTATAEETILMAPHQWSTCAARPDDKEDTLKSKDDDKDDGHDPASHKENEVDGEAATSTMTNDIAPAALSFVPRSRKRKKTTMMTTTDKTTSLLWKEFLPNPTSSKPTPTTTTYVLPSDLQSTSLFEQRIAQLDTKLDRLMEHLMSALSSSSSSSSSSTSPFDKARQAQTLSTSASSETLLPEQIKQQQQEPEQQQEQRYQDIIQRLERIAGQMTPAPELANLQSRIQQLEEQQETTLTQWQASQKMLHECQSRFHDLQGDVEERMRLVEELQSSQEKEREESLQRIREALQRVRQLEQDNEELQRRLRAEHQTQQRLEEEVQDKRIVKLEQSKVVGKEEQPHELMQGLIQEQKDRQRNEEARPLKTAKRKHKLREYSLLTTHQSSQEQPSSSWQESSSPFASPAKDPLKKNKNQQVSPGGRSESSSPFSSVSISSTRALAAVEDVRSNGDTAAATAAALRRKQRQLQQQQQRQRRGQSSRKAQPVSNLIVPGMTLYPSSQDPPPPPPLPQQQQQQSSSSSPRKQRSKRRKSSSVGRSQLRELIPNYRMDSLAFASAPHPSKYES